MNVAPLVGAWIEIRNKFLHNIDTFVAPLVGAWIEILYVIDLDSYGPGRSPRGSVD